MPHQDFASVKSRLQQEKGKTGANFQSLEYIDRFGDPLSPRRGVTEPPGPSTYFAFKPKAGGKSTAALAAEVQLRYTSGKTVSAPFRSLTAGHADYDLAQKGNAPAPGPAYYEPALPPGRKSHHLNARKLYLPKH